MEFVRRRCLRWKIYQIFYTNTITSGIFHYFYINTQNEEDGHTSA